VEFEGASRSLAFRFASNKASLSRHEPAIEVDREASGSGRVVVAVTVVIGPDVRPDEVVVYILSP
jgi:hypothetical protein